MPRPIDEYGEQWRKEHLEDDSAPTAVMEPPEMDGNRPIDEYGKLWRAQHEPSEPEESKPWTFTDNIITDIVKKAAAQTSVGLAARATGLSDYEEKVLGIGGDVAAGVLGFVGDPATWAGGGLAKAAVIGLEKIIGATAAKKLVVYSAKNGLGPFAARSAVGAIKPAVTLGAVTAARDPFEQYLETGSFDPLHTGVEVAKSSAVGALFGPAGQIPTKAGKIAGEVGAMALGGPAIEGRLPTGEDLEAAIYTVAGFKITGKAIDALLKNRAHRKAAGQKDPTPSKADFEAVDAPPEIADGTRNDRAAFLNAGEKFITGEFTPPPPEPPRAGEVDIPTEADARPFTISPTGEKIWGTAPGQEIADAVEVRQVEEGRVVERQGVGEVGPTAEAGRGDRVVEGGQVEAQGEVGDVLGFTSIKNAVTAQEREARGMPPAMEADPVGHSFPELRDQVAAMSAVEIESKAAELGKNPRAISDLEDAMLLRRQVELQNEYDGTVEALDAAKVSGDTARIAELEPQKQMQRDQLLSLYDTNKAVGTDQGRGLNARRMLAKKDFTLAKILSDRRSDEGVDELSQKSAAEAEADYRKIKETTEAHEASVAKEESVSAESAATEAVKEVVVQVVDEKPKQGSKRAAAARKELDDAWTAFSAEGQGTLFSLGGQLKSVPSALRLAKAWIKYKGVQFADFIADARKRLGEERAKKAEAALKEAWDRAIEEERPQPKTNLSDKAELAKHTRKLSEFFVRTQGIDTLKPMIDAVHPELQKVVPGITRLETIHALGRYGIFKPLDLEAEKVVVRDLKGQALQISKLAEMKEGRAAKASGDERATPSDTERHLQQQVNKAKKKGGFTDTDPAAHLKSTLDAKETWLKNRLTDLKAAIKSGQRLINRRGEPMALDPKDPQAKRINALQDEYNVLKKDYAEIFEKPGLTDDQRSAIALKAAEQSAEIWERKAQTGDISSLARGRETKVTPELEAARARRDAAKAEVQHLRDLANPKKTPDERNTAALDASLKRRVADYLERAARGDFEPKVRKVTKPSENTERLRFEAEKAKTDYLRARAARRRALRTTPQKIFEGGQEVLNLSRASLTSMDVSATLRHGGFFAMAHPVKAFNIFRGTFGTIWSEARASKEAYEVSQRTNAKNGQYKRDGLQITDPHGKLSGQEEVYMSHWARKLPWIAASERVFVAFLNRLRVETYDAMEASLGRGGKITSAQGKVIANFVNVATGRGNLGKFNAAAVPLATVFFAPRYVVSRFQLLAGQPLWKGDFQSRKLIATEYARAITGVAVFYGIAAMALEALIGPPSKDKYGWSIESDPRSSDFGKIRIGQSRIDPWFGLQQATVLLSRVISGETKTLKGKVKDIRGKKVEFGTGNTADVLGRFARTKLSPWLGTGIDIAAGKDLIGRPVTPTSVAGNMLVPISMQSIYDAMKAQGVPTGAALGILDLFGMSVQTYDAKRLKKAG